MKKILILLLVPIISVKAMSVEIDNETYTDFILASSSIHDNSTIKFDCDDASEHCQMTIADVKDITIDINGSKVTGIIGDFSGTITNTKESGTIGYLYLGDNQDSNNYEISINKVPYINQVSIFSNMKTTFTSNIIIDSFNNYGKSLVDVYFINTFNNFKDATLTIAKPENGFEDLNDRTIPGSKEAVVNNYGGDLTIEDGYFNYVQNKCQEDKAPQTVINNGTFNSPKTLRNYCGTLKIANGNFMGDVLLEQKKDTNNDVSTVFYDGTYNFEIALFNIKDGEVTINNGTYKSKGKSGINNDSMDSFYDTNYSIYVGENGILNFNKGTITLERNASNDGIVVNGTFNHGDKDKEINKEAELLYLNDNKLVFNKGTFNFNNGSIFLDNKIDSLKSAIPNYVLFYEEKEDKKYQAYLKPLSDQKEEKIICKRVDDKFYDKNGNVVSKADYEKSCPEKVPDTGMIIPAVGIAILAILYIFYTMSKEEDNLNKI